MMRGFAGQSTALIVLSLFYSVFFFIGFWMLRAHVIWWSQIAKHGSFKLLALSPLVPGQVVNFRFSGFKQFSKNEPLTVSLVAENSGRDSDGDTTWREVWRSTPMTLSYLPDPTGLNKALNAISQPLTLAPYAGATAQNELRWSVQVQQASHHQTNKSRGFKFNLAPDTVAALGSSALQRSTLVQAGTVEPMGSQRQSFAKLFKFVPALFFIAFFWDAIWPLLKRYI